MTEKVSILEEAQGIIHGARNKDYGHPLDNHSTTAEMWTSYLARKYGTVPTLDASDVCVLNILQKVSRYANAPKRDSLVDMAGYAGNIEMVEDEYNRRYGAALAEPS